MQVQLAVFGLGIAGAALVAFMWSINYPERRIWPPRRYTWVTPILVWVPTFTLFGILIVIGIWGWGTMGMPHLMRFGLGIPLILLGNLVVWSEVSHFGMQQTGGAKGPLRTAGMYRYSRNPQYMADIAIVAGWAVLSAAPLAITVGIAAIIVLIAAPFAEEPWLEEQYGEAFEEYCARVRRFL